MDNLFNEIGVTKSAAEENELLMLRSIMGSSSNGAVPNNENDGNDHRKSFTTLAQSIVENQDILDDEQDLQLTDEMKAALATRFGKGKNKRKAKVLDLEYMQNRYRRSSDDHLAVSQEALNTLVTNSSRKKSRNGNDKKVIEDDEEEEVSCPLCQRSLSSLSHLQINKHIDRCSRRGSNFSSSTAASESAAEETSDKRLRNIFHAYEDEDDDEDDAELYATAGRKSSKSTLQNKSNGKKRTKPNSSSDEEDVSGPDNSHLNTKQDQGEDEDEEEIVVAKTFVAHKDDWEESDFNARQLRLSQPMKESFETNFGTKTCRNAWENLFEYQREGCRWLFQLFREGVGGILADEMGLGKTAQVAVHFGALGRMNHLLNARRQAMFLIVCPATVLVHWVKEMHRWAPTMRTGILHTISSTGKEMLSLPSEDLARVLKNIRRSEISDGITVITSYETMRRSVTALTTIEWTAVCLDEGHKIRNPDAAVTVACKQLPAFHRLILSGTPIQNSLLELWCLFDFIYPGKLGSRNVFEEEFAYPIRMGAYAHATKLQYEIAIRCAGTLQRLVRPYLLRRKKDDLAQVAHLPPKTEQVLFCPISQRQRNIYEQILDSEEVKKVIARRTPAFRAISLLRKLCNHPALVYQDGAIQWAIVKDMRDLQHRQLQEQKQYALDAQQESTYGNNYGNHNNYDDDEEDEEFDMVGDQKRRNQSNDDQGKLEEEDDEEDALLQKRLSSKGTSIRPSLLDKTNFSGETDRNNQILWSDSGKLLVLSKILPIWQREGHKVLVFCQTTSMLSIIEQMVLSMQFNYLRLDGHTPIGKRDQLIQQFNQDANIYVMLLTTRTGGVGISLTAANRIVLFDPDWNPMTDIQARERAWRLGQRREVVIYRLITKGTIEEKIYHRQIFKLLLSHRVLDDPKQKNLFSKSQMQELFELAPPEQPHPPHNSAASNPFASQAPTAENDQGHLTAFMENRSQSYSSTVHSQQQGRRQSQHSGIPGQHLPSAGHVDLWQGDEEDDGIQDHNKSTSATSQIVVNSSSNNHNNSSNNSSSNSNSNSNSSSNGRSLFPFHTETITAEKRQEEAEVYDMLVDLHGNDQTFTTAEGDDHDGDEEGESNKKSAAKATKSSAASSSINTEHQAHDRKLLRALFNGDAILSIYSHDYLEPGNMKYKSKQQQEEAQRLALQAERQAQRAFQSLQSSSTVYNHQNHVSNVSSSNYTSTNNNSSSSSNNNSNHNSNNGDVLGRYFGSVQANQQDTSQSSSSLLAAIRQRDPLQLQSQTQQLTGNTTGNGNTDDGNPSTVSIEEQLQNRLLALFRTTATTAKTSAGNDTLSIPTNVILRHFRDLGDQYAPLFRRLLRTVAILKEGNWLLRAKYVSS